MSSSMNYQGTPVTTPKAPGAGDDDVKQQEGFPEWPAQSMEPPEDEKKVGERATGDRRRDRHPSGPLNNARPEMPQETPALEKQASWCDQMDTRTRLGNTNDQLHTGKYKRSFAVNQEWLNQGNTIADLGTDVMTPAFDMPDDYMTQFREFYSQHEKNHPDSTNRLDEKTGVDKRRYHSGLYHAGTQMKHPKTSPEDQADPAYLGGKPLAQNLSALMKGDRVRFNDRYLEETGRQRDQRQVNTQDLQPAEANMVQMAMQDQREFLEVEVIHRYYSAEEKCWKGYVGFKDGPGFSLADAKEYLEWAEQANYDYVLGAKVRDMMNKFVDSEHCPFDRHVTRTEDQGVQKSKRLVDFRFIHNFSDVEAQKWHVDYGRGSGSVIFFITLTPAFETFCTEYVSNRCRKDRNGDHSWVATTPIGENKMVIMSPGAIHRRGPDRQPELDRQRIFFSCGYIDEDKMDGLDGAMRSDEFNPAKKQFSYIDDFTQPHPIKTAFEILDNASKKGREREVQLESGELVIQPQHPSFNATEDMAEGWSAYEPEVPEQEAGRARVVPSRQVEFDKDVMCIKRTEETSDQEGLREDLEQGKLSFEAYCQKMNAPRRFHRSRSESV